MLVTILWILLGSSMIVNIVLTAALLDSLEREQGRYK